MQLHIRTSSLMEARLVKACPALVDCAHIHDPGLQTWDTKTSEISANSSLFLNFEHSFRIRFRLAGVQATCGHLGRLSGGAARRVDSRTQSP